MQAKAQTPQQMFVLFNPLDAAFDAAEPKALVSSMSTNAPTVWP